MKRIMLWVMAATLLISGLTVFTACTNEDDPVKREPKMMLVSREYTDIEFYGHIMEKYTYDADYRLVNMKTIQVSTGEVLSDLDYIYTPGHITKKGRDYDYDITDECRLDDQGRIVEYHHKNVKIETGKLLADEKYTLTYDENGHLATMLTETSEQTFVWEGDELRSAYMTENTAYLTETYEPSDAPAQTLFNWYGYKVPELCQQGCFGVLPAHMPAKLTLVLYISDNLVTTINYEYKYTTIGGRLSTATKNNSSGDYILHWEQI